MKVKYFITGFLFSLFLTGCEVTAVDRISYDGRLSRHDVTLVASGILDRYLSPTYYQVYDDGYYYDYYDDIIIEDSYIGEVSLVTVDEFYGYPSHNPYRGNLKIINDDMIIYLDVVDDYYVDVTVYDEYDSDFDMTFRTTWVELGF